MGTLLSSNLLIVGRNGGFSLGLGLPEQVGLATQRLLLARIVVGQTGTGGNQTADDDVFLETTQVVALAHEMRNAGISYQRHLHVTAVDVDPKSVHMAYLQFSLLHIPAIIIHGNSLNLEEFGRWYTPAHIMDGWSWKLRRTSEGAHPVERVPEPELHPSKPRDDDPPIQPSQLTLF